MNYAEACRILGLSNTQHPEQAVKNAYKAAAKKAHPDAGGSDAEFKRVTLARDVLLGTARPTAQAKAAPQPVKPTVAQAEFGPQHSREDWLRVAYNHIAAHAKLAGIDMPSLRWSVGYGAGGTRGKRQWDRIDQTADKMPQAFIRPEVTDAAAVLKLVKDAAADLDKTKTTAAVLDVIWPMAEADILKELGPYPQASVSAQQMKKQKQPTRLLKAECPGCGYTIRLSKKWADAGLPDCICGDSFELV